MDYIVGEHRLIDFAYVRNCLLKDEKINFNLVQTVDIEFKETPAMEEVGLSNDTEILKCSCSLIQSKTLVQIWAPMQC
jgi:hypothetical protein